MNHRRSRRGYHSRLVLGTIAAGLLPACLPVRAPAPQAPPPHPLPGEPLRAERTAVVAQINAARTGVGLARLRYDPLLERVGDAHCAILIEEGGESHFSRSGVPPYLRWMLAGGHGFHMENVGSYSTTGKIVESALGRILARSVTNMLEEVPPADGHRRALLNPWVTHIGVGLAWSGGELRMTHELATEVTEEWAEPAVVASPHTKVELSGRLPHPWQPGAVEALWEALPHALTDAQVRAIRSYGYPPRRAMLYANRPVGELEPLRIPGAWDPRNTTAPFTVDRQGEFSYRWSTGPHDGVEIVLLWARDGGDRPYVPVAASATVVVATGKLPPELDVWYQLGRTLERSSPGDL